MAIYIITFDNKILKEYTKGYFEKYPRRSKAPIDSPLHPSINKWFIMKRPQMNDLKQKWGDFTEWVVKKYGYENLHINKATITFKYYFGNKRRQDCDNRVPKFCLDGLTKAGVIIDDDFEHINPLITWGGYDKENPRMVIIIETMEDN
jgi:Holliday junction resolvase RusA-like endonuclease